MNTRTYAGATMGGNNLFKVSATAKPGVHSLHNHIDAGVYTVNIEFTGSGNFTGVTCVPYTVTLAAFTLKVQHALTGPTGNRWREGPRGRNQRRASRHKPHPTINSNLDIATAVSIQKSSSRVDTGMTLHQFFLDCPLTRHEFEGPSQMEMAVMYPYDSTQRENSIEVSVRGGGFANNVKAGEKEQHVRVYFRSDARFEAGSKITTTIRSYVDSSCDGNWRGVEEDNGITVPALSSEPFATYVNSFNLPERQTWSYWSNHNTVAVTTLNRYDTRRARQDTGIRIHVGNTACVTTNIWLLAVTNFSSTSGYNTPFRLIKNTQGFNTSANNEEESDEMAMGGNNSDYYWLVTRSSSGTWNEPFYSRPGAFDFRFQVANFDQDCEAERRVFRPSPNRYDVTVQITIHDAWDNWYKRTSAQRTDYESETPFDADKKPSTPDGGATFSPVRLATITRPQAVGVSIKRIQYHCQIANVALLEGENEYFDLNVY
ncbi:MAG: hypothetical protein ISN28_01120, partial [Ectothiorhodospiraceae bacterium AqS1]|nr:hypothetical protein [Ectothiorhodospiraceae bacterium AqS1]